MRPVSVKSGRRGRLPPEAGSAYADGHDAVARLLSERLSRKWPTMLKTWSRKQDLPQARNRDDGPLMERYARRASYGRRALETHTAPQGAVFWLEDENPTSTAQQGRRDRQRSHEPDDCTSSILVQREHHEDLSHVQQQQRCRSILVYVELPVGQSCVRATHPSPAELSGQRLMLNSYGTTVSVSRHRLGVVPQTASSRTIRECVLRGRRAASPAWVAPVAPMIFRRSPTTS